MVWMDASSEPNWLEESEAVGELVTCRTVGWLMRDDEELLVVAASRNSRGQVSDVLTVPRQWVREVVKLRRR